jgi:hypothetical protein
MYFEKEQDLIHVFLDLPSALTMLKKMEHTLDLEKHNRKNFYDDIDGMIAEFSNSNIVIHSPIIKEHTDNTCNITQPFLSMI